MKRLMLWRDANTGRYLVTPLQRTAPATPGEWIFLGEAEDGLYYNVLGLE